MSEREITRDKRRVLERLQQAPKFMPYLHNSVGLGEIEKLLGSVSRAQRALVALVQDRKVEYLENCSPDHYRAFAEVAPAPSVVDEIRQQAEQVKARAWAQVAARGASEQRVRATLAPSPELHYPTPWRVAETNAQGRVVVVCADGSYAAECPNGAAAEAIVLAVNTFAGANE